MKRYIAKEKKNVTERVSFYIALSVCIFAVGMAIWSVYDGFDEEPKSDSSSYFSSLKTSPTQAVAQEMTGITEAASAPTLSPTQAPTEMPTESPKRTKGFTVYETLPPTEETELTEELDAMQAVLKVAESLVFPVKSGSVIKPYSEDAVYSKTMQDHRAHTGCDFAACEGENVYAMCDGKVNEISVSELYGVIVEVNSPGFSVYYCGLSNDVKVEKGDSISAGDTIGTVGQIPSESADDPHIHVEIRVGKKLIDPLSVINKDD